MTGVTGASLTVFQPDGWWWVVKCDIYDVSDWGEGNGYMRCKSSLAGCSPT